MAKAIRISGQKLKELREGKLWTQANLASRIGVSVGRVSSIEAKKEAGVYAGTFALLAEAFGMPPADLRTKLAAGAAETVTLELPRATYDGLKARADAEKMNLAEWLADQASLGAVVIGPTPPSAPSSTERVRRGARSLRPEPAGPRRK